MTILNRSEITAISPAFSGDPAEASAARRFVSRRLGAVHPCHDASVQATGELIAESIRHSARCGGAAGYAITLSATPLTARVALSAQSRCPCWARPVLGSGIHLIELLTPYWGVRPSNYGVTVWFEIVTLG